MKKDKQPEAEKSEDEAEDESHKCSGDETVEGSSSTTDCDQDSDVSFVNDTDEEIDTAEIDQEERIEYIKRSTAEAEELMKKANIPCWIETQRNEVAIGDVNTIATKGMVGKESSRMESRPQQQNQDKQRSWKTKKEMGRRIQRFLKQKETEATKGSDIKSSDTWMWEAKRARQVK